MAESEGQQKPSRARAEGVYHSTAFTGLPSLVGIPSNQQEIQQVPQRLRQLILVIEPELESEHTSVTSSSLPQSRDTAERPS